MSQDICLVSVRCTAGCRHSCRITQAKPRDQGLSLSPAPLQDRRGPQWGVSQLFLSQLFWHQSDPRLQGCTGSGLPLSTSRQNLHGVLQSLLMHSGPKKLRIIRPVAPLGPTRVITGPWGSPAQGRLRILNKAFRSCYRKAKLDLQIHKCIKITNATQVSCETFITSTYLQVSSG